MLVLPSKSAAVWEKFLKENKVLVYKYIFKELKQGIKNKEKSVTLFKFEGNDVSAWIPKSNYLQTLQEALKVFISAEEYEYAEKVKEVINIYFIEDLIKDNRTE